MNIGVLGLGYVGTVTAACLSHLGHTVLGVDIDQRKVEDINNGVAPFYEPRLSTMVRKEVKAGSLQATMKVEDLSICEIVFICVGTPVVNNEVNLEYLNRALISLNAYLADEKNIVVIRSTVPPGTCAKIQNDCAASIVFCPEFLREGSAIEDFLNPGVEVYGVASPEYSHARSVGQFVQCAFMQVGKMFYPGKNIVKYAEAEMLKYACNAYHALKICFANEIDAIATSIGVDGKAVMKLFVQDTKLNISEAYLRPGFAFGGSCLEKDIKALCGQAYELDVPLLDEILRSNEQQVWRSIDLLNDRKDKKIGIIGLAFKENTDDLRNSPALTLIRNLDSYKEIKIYAPDVDVDRLFGANLEELNVKVTDYKLDFKSALVGLVELLTWADVVVITHKVDIDVSVPIFQYAKAVIDLSGHYKNVL